jgi:t-SNARE complex subunit (syntaxin)
LVESHARREDSLNRIIERLQSQPVVQIDVFNEQSSRLQSQQLENINLRSEVQNLHGELSAMKENSRQTQRLVE